MSNRINPASTSVERAAIILVDRLGTYAYREASNRSDRAVNLRTDTQAFYWQVMSEVSKLLDANPDRCVPLRVREARARRDRMAQRSKQPRRTYDGQAVLGRLGRSSTMRDTWRDMDPDERAFFLVWISDRSQRELWPLSEPIRAQLFFNSEPARLPAGHPSKQPPRRTS